MFSCCSDKENKKDREEDKEASGKDKEALQEGVFKEYMAIEAKMNLAEHNAIIALSEVVPKANLQSNSI